MQIFLCTFITFTCSFFGSYILLKFIHNDISGPRIFFRGHLKNSSKIKNLISETINDYIEKTFDGLKSFDIFVEEDFSEYSNRNMFIVEALVYYDNNVGEPMIRYIQFTFNSRFKNLCLYSFLQSFTEEDFVVDDDFSEYVMLDYRTFKKFNKYGLNKICERHIDISSSVKNSMKVKSFNVSVADFVYDIKNDILEALKLSKSIKDIDISVSISDLSETTDIFLDMIIKEENEKEFISLSSHYKESVEKILDILKNFNSLKDKGSLSETEELKLQEDIDKEVNNCSKYAKLE